MTPQEALHEISIKAHQYTDDIKIIISKDCYKEIVNALEKQTPKRPNKIGYPIDSDTDPLVYGYCPCCNTHRDSSKGFCDKCGQALDWSDTE